MPGKKSRTLFIAVLLGLSSIAAPTFAASKEKVLYSFCPAQLCPDGQTLWPVVLDAAGNLYGSAYYGGNSNCIRGCGTVFELTRADGKWKQKVLHHFENDGRDGYYPAASLIFDAAGNLYGTTSQGGADQAGTVFELVPEKNGKWKEKILHSFVSSPMDGSEPDAALVLDASGNLYGTTQFGGAYGDYYGVVFTLNPGANGLWSEKLLHSFDFNGTDGYNPLAGLLFDSSGNLYGTTESGGTTTNGTVFEMTPGKNGSWTEKVLYNFMGVSDGSLSNAGLVRDSAGSLYSTTVAGGDPHCTYGGGCGTVFKLTPDAKGKWTFTTIHMFQGKDGAFPGGGVIFDGTGNLYGVTTWGGAGGCQSGCGTVFKLTPAVSGGKWTEKVLHSFNDNGVDGWEPDGGLIIDAAGNLYGTTYSGGAYGYGAVFAITP